MKYAAISTAVLAAAGAYAAPASKAKRSDIDTTILNFALTLEHVEVAFYTGALAKFNESVFEAAGFPSYVRKRYVEIQEHEETHVSFLSTALGKDATQPCNYSFPYTDLSSFTALSAVIEGVGTSAYLGAAHLLTDEDYITAAGSILATEARQQAWLASAVQHGAPWSTAFQTPLDMDQAFSLAAGFIDSCPSTNPKLPVMAFPALSIAPASPTPGSVATFTYDGHGAAGPCYAAFLSGLDTFFAPIATNGSVTIPASLIGTVYVVVTTNDTVVSDASTVAGPAPLLFPF